MGGRKGPADSGFMSPVLEAAEPSGSSRNGPNVVAEESRWIQTVSHTD